ncbi:MAG TPA: hydrogenase expression/formation protein HypE [Candidatus Latescibacteria bacterium]|nr:hydrogenase expression/formation protein HypE [Candidatus Latescibacterota bacterium]
MKGDEKILLSHGSGGKLTHDLIRKFFLQRFLNPILLELTDSALVDGAPKLAFTTDSYVVKPLFFPGGDIGKLAVAGTVNDLAVMGAEPKYISCGFIIEEGHDMEPLCRIVDSMRRTAEAAGVLIVTGDTKVVGKDEADQLFINTSGIGFVDEGVRLSVNRVRVGDRIILSGSVGDHGIAVLSQRGGFEFEVNVKSDCAPLNGLISKVLAASDKVKFMRDPTRGGLATALNEIVGGREFGILIEEEKIPVKEGVRAVCELLGLDPLYLANEGKVVVVVASEDADQVLEAMRQDRLGKDAEIIGTVVEEPKGMVCLKTVISGTRIVDMLVADQLPRIC